MPLIRSPLALLAAAIVLTVLMSGCGPNRRRTAARTDGGSREADATMDAFVPAGDAGPLRDGGPPTADSGRPGLDGGAPRPDSGSPRLDAGVPVFDAGIPTFDGGLPTFDAGFGLCASELDCDVGRCCPIFGGLPIMVCVDAPACPDAGLGF